MGSAKKVQEVEGIKLHLLTEEQWKNNILRLNLYRSVKLFYMLSPILEWIFK